MDDTSFYTLPAGLPVPVDDGACDHLPGMRPVSMPLRSTSGRDVDLSATTGRVVVYCYPRTGMPGERQSDDWDAVPGARGCTPQSCAFRDLHARFRELGVEVFGMSTQSTEYQQELVERIHLPFEVLSDEGFRFTDAHNLPTFEFEGVRLMKRFTLLLRDGVIEHVFYPVFPTDRNATEVLAWLREDPSAV